MFEASLLIERCYTSKLIIVEGICSIYLIDSQMITLWDKNTFPIV